MSTRKENVYSDVINSLCRHIFPLGYKHVVTVYIGYLILHKEITIREIICVSIKKNITNNSGNA